MFVVYLLTREDKKQYIGICKKERFRIRMREHSYSDRFLNLNFKTLILKEVQSIEEARELEKNLVKEYNTFNCGLNRTIDGAGNHLSEKFTTLGYAHTNETKIKISKANRNKTPWNKNIPGCFSKETIEKMKRTRKDRCFKPPKLQEDQVKEIKQYYSVFSLGIEMVLKNGKLLSKEEVVARIFSEKFKVTKACVRMILKGKTWKHV